MIQYALSDFNGLIKQTLATNMEQSYWIVAEIGQINIQVRGHCYIELVEKETNFVKAKMRATIWSNTFIKLHQWFISVTGSPLKQGMKILFNGKLNFHEVYGLNINIQEIDANFTLGERERKKRETISLLTQEGIMDMNQMLDLPKVVQRVAIISSENAAGYEDFQNQFANNSYGYTACFQLFPSVMQGDKATESIISSLHQIYAYDDYFEAVVIIRGGGSQLDLDCFDDYNLCVHLAQFPLPIITGIGHERDQSIADLVAHTQLKTPTSVAEFLIGEMLAFETRIQSFMNQINQKIQVLLNSKMEHIQDKRYRVSMILQQKKQEEGYKIGNLKQMIDYLPSQIIAYHKVSLESIQKLIATYHPQNILEKGYTITKVNGKASLLSQVKKGDIIATVTHNQLITSTVNEIK